MASKAGQTQLRLRIAQVAAQLMTESGIRDYAFAKRKAARQLGVSSPHGLPSNDEVDAALNDYRELFEPEARSQDLDALRRQALVIMQRLNRFGPLLTGGAVTGAVTAYSDVEIDLHADSSKVFEQFLLNEDIPFKAEERPGITLYRLFSAPADVLVRVLPERTLHNHPSGREEARKRLTVTQLSKLIEQQADTQG
jgi:hypothetical protein